VIQGRREEAVVRGADDEVTAEVERDPPTQRPQPRPLIHHRPLESRDVRDVETSGDGNAVEGNEPESRQEDGEREHATGAEFGIRLMPRVAEGSLNAQDGGIEVPSTTQSAAIETQAEPPRRRNPVNMIPKYEV